MNTDHSLFPPSSHFTDTDILTDYRIFKDTDYRATYIRNVLTDKPVFTDYFNNTEEETQPLSKAPQKINTIMFCIVK